MIYIFLDESGDLGFKKSSSKWFIVTLVITNNHRPLEKAIKKTRNELRKKYKNISEMHAYHCDPSTRKKILRLLSKIDDLKVICVILNKQKVYVDLQSQKNLLYNYTANILLDRLNSKKIINGDDELYLCFDRKDTNKNIRENFEKYITQTMKKWRKGNVKLDLKSSYESKGLQAVDFISWAIFRKYELNDREYYDIISNKIIGESYLFK